MCQPVPIHQSAYTNWNGINGKFKRQRAEAPLEKSKAAEMKGNISKTKVKWTSALTFQDERGRRSDADVSYWVLLNRVACFGTGWVCYLVVSLHWVTVLLFWASAEIELLLVRSIEPILSATDCRFSRSMSMGFFWLFEYLLAPNPLKYTIQYVWYTVSI